jgi:hypothetical protein
VKPVIERPRFDRDVTLAFFSDTHGGIHDDAACRVAVSVCEAAGVDRIYLVGDGLDCGVSSRHDEKAKKAKIDHGTAMKERDSFGWFLDWMTTRESIYLLGNHEAWMTKSIELDPKFCHMSFAEVMRIPPGIKVLPQHSMIRIGSLVMEHGDAIFPKSSGGKNPASRLLDLFPDQSTIIGHLHHADSSYRTYLDEQGVPKYRRAEVNGHLSLIDQHMDYAGRHPNWQQRFLLIRIWHFAGRPKFTITPVDVFRDKRNRPLVEWEGRVLQ